MIWRRYPEHWFARMFAVLFSLRCALGVAVGRLGHELCGALGFRSLGRKGYDGAYVYADMRDLVCSFCIANG